MKAQHSRGFGWVTIQVVLLTLLITSALVKRRQWDGAASQVAGGALLVAAASYALSGFISLGRNLTPLPEPKADGTLVTIGAFAHVRHPIYASVMAAGFGWALLQRSWPGLLIALLQAVFLREKAKDEERRLQTRFPEYLAYSRKVPRFVPRLFAESAKVKAF